MNNHIQIIDGLHSYYNNFLFGGTRLHYWDISYSKKIKESFTTQIQFKHLAGACVELSIKQVGYGTESYFEKIFDYGDWDSVAK